MLEPGSTLGRFVILRLLGTGGMGVVYEARDPELGRSVALKLLAAERRADTGGLRLLREAQALAQLAHPNVVSVHDVGVADGGVFIAMEYVDGETLDAHLRGRSPGWRAVLELCLQAGRGLAAAHARSIVHRDFKPGNVIVDGQGRVRVTDFGLARLDGADESDPGAAPAAEGASAAAAVTTEGWGAPAAGDATPASDPDLLAVPLTAAGAVVGTPRYMAPEQREGRPASARSDQYAFCLTLWEALLGDMPPAAPRRAQVPRPLIEVLEVGLARAPEDRHPSMAALILALERAAARPRARRRMAIAAAALAIVGGGGAALATVAARPGPRCDRAGAEIQTVWGPAARSAVAAAFARARPDAPAAATLARVDAYATAWQAARVDACRATHERGEQSAALLDRRAACLDEGAVALRALTSALSRVDAVGADRALEAVHALPPLERCAPSRLAGAPAPSADPRAVAAARVLAQAEVASRLGHNREALLTADIALAGARTVNEPALLGRALLQHGRVIAERDVKGGRAELEEALVAAARSGDRTLEADVVLRLLRVLVEEGATERIETLLPAARAAVAAAGDDRQAHMLATSEARILIKAHAPAADIHAACARVAALEHQGEPPSAVECLCTAAVNARDVAEGKVQCARLIDAKIAYYGPDHPEVAYALNNLATIHDSAGEYEQALALLARAEPIYQRSFADGAQLVNLLVNFGNELDNSGRHAEARRRFEQALAITRRTSDKPSRRLAVTLVGVAGTAAKLGDTEAARRHAAEGLRVAEEVFGKDNPELVTYQLNVGQAYFDAGAASEALAVYQRGEALAARTMPGDLLQGMCLLGMAQSLNRLGREPEALTPAERALAIIAAVENDPYNVAAAHQAVGESLLALGQRGRARAELTAARAGFRVLGGAAAGDVAKVERLLAR